jgi:hypothetical protein
VHFQDCKSTQFKDIQYAQGFYSQHLYARRSEPFFVSNVQMQITLALVPWMRFQRHTFIFSDQKSLVRWAADVSFL